MGVVRPSRMRPNPSKLEWELGGAACVARSNTCPRRREADQRCVDSSLRRAARLVSDDAHKVCHARMARWQVGMGDVQHERRPIAVAVLPDLVLEGVVKRQ